MSIKRIRQDRQHGIRITRTVIIENRINPVKIQEVINPGRITETAEPGNLQDKMIKNIKNRKHETKNTDILYKIKKITRNEKIMISNACISFLVAWYFLLC